MKTTIKKMNVLKTKKLKSIKGGAVTDPRKSGDGYTA